MDANTRLLVPHQCPSSRQGPSPFFRIPATGLMHLMTSCSLKCCSRDALACYAIGRARGDTGEEENRRARMARMRDGGVKENSLGGQAGNVGG